MFLSKLGKKQRYLAYIAVFTVGFLVFERFMLQPIFGKLNQLNRDINQKETKLRKYLKISSQEEFIKSEYEQYTKEIKQELSNEKETAQLLSEIERIAKRADVSLTRMKPARINEKEFYKEFVIRIEAEATISRLIDFIYKLENFSKLIRTGEFRLVPKQKKSAILKMNMVIKSILIS